MAKKANFEKIEAEVVALERERLDWMRRQVSGIRNGAGAEAVEAAEHLDKIGLRRAALLSAHRQALRDDVMARKPEIEAEAEAIRSDKKNMLERAMTLSFVACESARLGGHHGPAERLRAAWELPYETQNIAEDIFKALVPHARKNAAEFLNNDPAGEIMRRREKSMRDTSLLENAKWAVEGASLRRIGAALREALSPDELREKARLEKEVRHINSGLHGR